MLKSQSLFKANVDEQRIRVTEGRRIYNRARIAEAEADGAPFICFRPVGDCCNYCKSLYENPDGSPKLFAISAFKKGLAQTGGTNQGVPKRQWSPYVEIAHPWCLTGDQRVGLPLREIKATSVRWFNGDVVDLQASSGNHLTATVNHPILTTNGWIGAGFLHVGDSVISSSRSEWTPGLNAGPYNENIPTRIEDVVRAFGMASSVASIPVPVSSEDFHGDGLGSEVTIIGTYGLLGSGIYASAGHHSSEFEFDSRHIGLPMLVGASAGFEGSSAGLSAARGLVGRSGEPTPFSDGSSAHSFIHGGRESAQGDASVLEAFGESSAAYATLASEILHGATGPIFADKLVKIRRYQFSGQVYNLETELGSYIAEGIVTHNCRCRPEAIYYAN